MTEEIEQMDELLRKHSKLNCRCSDGFHDGNNIDCACGCHDDEGPRYDEMKEDMMGIPQ